MKRIPMTDLEVAQRGRDPRKVQGYFLRPETRKEALLLLSRRWEFRLLLAVAGAALGHLLVRIYQHLAQ